MSQDSTLAKARRLIEMADHASARPWATTPMSATAVVSIPGDAELGNWMVCERVRWPTDRAFIAAARNDAPDIARALVEAVGLLWDIARHADIPGEAAKQIIGGAARAFLAEHDGERREG